MRNYQQPADTITVIAPRTVAAGEGVLVGQTFGIAKHAAASGATLELARTGIFNPVTKAAGQVWAIGVRIYWDNTAFAFTTTLTSNTLVGSVAAAAISGAVVGAVLLDGAVR